MRLLKIAQYCAAIFVTVSFLAGCAATKTQAPEIAHNTAVQDGKVLVMPLDIEVSELTAAGLNVPRADWTEQAEGHFLNSQNSILNAQGVDLLLLPEEARQAARDDILTQTTKLHAAVGGSILLHGDGSLLPLPTKENAFDWTLGQEVREISSRYDADYALFVYMRDSFSTGGRAAVIILGALLGVSVQGGQQVGFATLVDLQDGDILWFRTLRSTVGDLRTPEGAREAASDLFEDFPL